MYAVEEQKWLDEKFNPQYKEELRHRKSVKVSYYLDADHAECNTPNCSQTFNYDLQGLYKLGGERLVALYKNHCNFKLTAQQLSIKESTLRSFIYRLRSTLNKLNITPEEFDLQFRIT